MATTKILPFRAELSRKAIHLSTLSIPIWILIAPPVLMEGMLILTALSVLTLDQLLVSKGPPADLVRRRLLFMVRHEEQQPLLRSKLILTGASYLMIAVVMLTLFFPPMIAAAALAIFIVGDAGAAIVGVRYGQRRVGMSGKTWEGLLAFWLCAIPVAVFFPAISLGVFLLAVIGASVAELVCRRSLDNLFGPMTAALIFVLLA